MKTFWHLLFGTLAVLITAYLLPGVEVAGFFTAFVVAVVLTITSTILGPVLLILTLPVNIATLGLFTFVIIAFLVMLVSALVPGFHVSGFWPAVAFAFVLVIVNSVFDSLDHH